MSILTPLKHMTYIFLVSSFLLCLFDLNTLPPCIKLRWILKHISHIQLKYISLSVQYLPYIRYSAAKVPMDKLFNVCPSRGQYVQLKEVFIQKSSLQGIHFLLSLKLATSM